MQFDKAKKWWPFAIALLMLWLGFYAWAWMARHGCGESPIGQCWSAAAAGWAADVVMFKWVDATLGAGMLAVVAASAVFLNGAIERRAREEEASVEQEKSLLASIVTIRLGFRAISFGCISRDDPEYSAQSIDALQGQLGALGVHLPNVAMRLSYLLSMAAYRARQWGREKDEKVGKRFRSVAAAWCEVGVDLLSQPDIVRRDPAVSEVIPPTGPAVRGRLLWKDLDEHEKRAIGKYMDVSGFE